MDLVEMTDSMVSFSRDNPLIAAAFGVVLLILLYRKPKLVLGLLGLAIVFALALYFIMDVASVGKAEKGKMIQKNVQPKTDTAH